MAYAFRLVPVPKLDESPAAQLSAQSADNDAAFQPPAIGVPERHYEAGHFTSDL
jgi:hypothetical protein